MKKIAFSVLEAVFLFIMTGTVAFADLANPNKPKPSSPPVLLYAAGVLVLLVIAVYLVSYVRTKKKQNKK